MPELPLSDALSTGNSGGEAAHEIYLVTVSGQDRPGVTAALMEVLAESGVVVLDIGQSVIHELLSLGLLVLVPAAAGPSPVLKDLLYKAHELDLRARFTPVGGEDYARWVNEQGKPRHIVTVLGERLGAGHLQRVASIIAAHGLNIDVITRLSGRIPLDGAPRAPYACVEMSVRGKPGSEQALRADFLAWAHESGVDVAVQSDDVFRRTRRLVAFDMDSTLIQAEVIDELAREAGVGEEVARITEAAMRGEMDFAQSLRRRVAALAGLDAAVLERVAGRLPITPGAERLMGTLRRLGFKTAIISGGFQYFGERLRGILGIDYLFANDLEIRDNKLTGQLAGRIIDGPAKADCLREIAAREQIDLRQAVAVGDGANDLPMLSIAGLGIAFRAKPAVKQSAGQALSTVGLDAILYLIGMRDREAPGAGDGNQRKVTES